MNWSPFSCTKKIITACQKIVIRIGFTHLRLWLMKERVHLSRRVLKRAISQQLHVTFFAFETLTGGEFSYLIRFRVWGNDQNLLLFNKLWVCLTYILGVQSVCGKFSYWCFSDLRNVIRNLLPVKTCILAALNLWDMKNSLSK